MGCDGGVLSRAKTDSQGPLQVGGEPGNEFAVFVQTHSVQRGAYGNRTIAR